MAIAIDEKKAKQAAYDKIRNASPEGILRNAAYHVKRKANPERMAKDRARQAEYLARPDVQERKLKSRAEYRARPEVIAQCKAYEKTDEVKSRRAVQRVMPEAVEKRRVRHLKYAATKAIKKSSLRRIYGISINDYEGMLADQHYLCRICRKDMDSPHVDHDHVTGKVRGILCGLCNTGLGLLKDNIENLHNAINYLGEAA